MTDASSPKEGRETLGSSATLSLLVGADAATVAPQVSVAVGCATRNRTVPFCSAFGAFFTRAFDQIRMAAISESNINFCGSHCGVSIGKSCGARRLAAATSLDVGTKRCGGGGGWGVGFHSVAGGFIRVLPHTPGEDGPSQMALEDLAMFRSIPTATVFYPSDAVSTEKAVELAANTKVGHVAVCGVGVGVSRPAQRWLFRPPSPRGGLSPDLAAASWGL